MTSIVGGRDDKFYEALKNSQPLAFLASISIGIAVLIHSTSQQLPTIYNYAIIAGAMFLASFITSLVYQLLAVSQEFKQQARWSQYAFMAFGILYLFLIMLNFSQTIPQIIFIVFGWGMLAIVIPWVIPLKKQLELEKRNKGKLAQIVIVIVFHLGLSALFFTFAFAPQLVVNHTHAITLQEFIGLTDTISVKH